MAMQIQIRRTSGSDEPTSLLSGELAFVEGTKEMYIGAGNPDNDTVVVKKIKPEFITYATEGNSDKLMLEDVDGSHKYILEASNITEDITYKLPNSLPVSTVTKSILVCTMVGNEGQLSYGSVAIQKLENIGDVNFDGNHAESNNKILMFDGSAGEWVGKAPTDLTDELSLGTETNQTYDNLHLLGSLEVKGDSVQLNGTNLAIRDKLIGVGVTRGTVQVTATQAGQLVTISASSNTSADLNSLTDGDFIFVGEGWMDVNLVPRIPSQYYQISRDGSSDITFTSSDPDGQTNDTLDNTPFDLVISERSTNAEVDNSGLVFPGSTTKSLLWTDAEDRFKLVGGDLKVSGEEVYFGEEKVIDSNDSGEKVITGLNINTSQVTGTFNGGDFE